ncbi:hypothetical protein HK104_002507, partial [Borealophlyctis nickersoniae]
NTSNFKFDFVITPRWIPLNGETLLSLAQEIDTIYFAFKNRNAVTPYRPSAHRPAPANTSGPTPMDIDSATVTKRAPLTAAERKHLIANKGCFYCPKINCGDQVRNCPDKIADDKAKQLKVNAAAASTAAASSTASSTPKSGNGLTQN